MAIQWDASWTASRRNTVDGALERIERMLTRAYLSVKAVPRDQEALTLYVNHFDNPSLSNLDHVTSVIRLMYERVTMANQDLQMTYVPDQNAFDALHVGPLPLGVDIADVEAFVIQLGVPPATLLRMFVAPAFFTGNVYIPNAPDQRSGTGTLLHELSHGVGNTRDYAYTWAPQYAALTANQRAQNADSYRAYCQSFDMKN